MMTDIALSPYVFDATADNFAQLVLGNSERGLVLVHFWSPRAGPCMVLMPRLVRLAGEYGGRLLLVMANTDELGRIAREWGVTSVPTVKFFRSGRVVHTIHGAESDASFRAAIDPLLARPSDALHAEAVALFGQGQAERAYALLAQAALDDPDNPRLPVDLAKLMTLNGEHQRAYDFLDALPPPAASRPEAEQLLIHLTFLLAAQGAPEASALRARILADPDDLEARLQHAAQRLFADDYPAALDELLEITRRDRGYRRDLGRRAILAVLGLPGVPQDLVSAYRLRLAEALH